VDFLLDNDATAKRTSVRLLEFHLGRKLDNKRRLALSVGNPAKIISEFRRACSASAMLAGVEQGWSESLDMFASLLNPAGSRSITRAPSSRIARELLRKD
jgi:hypothetical protein